MSFQSTLENVLTYLLNIHNTTINNSGVFWLHLHFIPPLLGKLIKPDTIYFNLPLSKSSKFQLNLIPVTEPQTADAWIILARNHWRWRSAVYISSRRCYTVLPSLESNMAEQWPPPSCNSQHNYSTNFSHSQPGTITFTPFQSFSWII